MMQVENVYIKPGGGQMAINAKIIKRNSFEVNIESNYSAFVLKKRSF